MKTLEVTNLTKVESSNIDLVAFNNNTTFVQFKNGGIYSYADTSKEVFDALLNAKSVGKHLNTAIKGNFEYAKVEDSVLKLKVDKPLTLLEQINNRLNTIKKSEEREVYEIKALTLLKSELINNTKAKKPQDELKLTQGYHKSLLKTAEVYRTNGALAHERQFLNEAGFVAQFLPKQMTDDEVVNFISMAFKIHDYEGLGMGEIIGKIKNGIGDKTSNGKLIASEVKKQMGV